MKFSELSGIVATLVPIVEVLVVVLVVVVIGGLVLAVCCDYLRAVRGPRDVVNRFPIRGYVGPNGDGKSYGVFEDVILPAWMAGKVVHSNTILYPERAGFPPELYHPCTTLVDLLDVYSGVVYFGEIASCLPARGYQDVPGDIVRRLKQLRKRRVCLVWDSPSWEDADIALRRVTRVVTVCRGSSVLVDPWVRVPGTARPWRPFGRRFVNPEGHNVKVEGWPSKCLLVRRTYDVRQFRGGEFSEADLDGKRPKETKRRWRPFYRVSEAYDTLEEVLLFDHIDKGGICLDCGGVRRPGPCKCPAKVDEARVLSSSSGPLIPKVGAR